MPSYDLDEIKSLIGDQWPEIICQSTGIDPSLLDGEHHPCPKCGGTDRFRFFTDGTGGAICNQCHTSKNGDGFATIAWLTDKPFTEVVQDVAGLVGAKPTAGSSKTKADPAENLVFDDWTQGNKVVAGIWCLAKKPITFEAIEAAGGRIATYRKRYRVIAFPVYGSDLEKIIGWTIYNVSGGTLPKFRGPGEPAEWVKVKNTYGTTAGVIGTVDRLADAKVVWKTEGPTDMLAMLVADPKAAVICNAMGAKEKAKPWMLKLLEGKKVNVIHDADKPGQDGATYVNEGDKSRPGWCPRLAVLSSEVRNIQLPYEIDTREDGNGKDLRLFVQEGGDPYTLVDKTEVFPRDPDVDIESDVAEEEIKPVMAMDDPFRLAELNLKKYATLRTGRTIVFWRSDFYIWRDDRYEQIAKDELEAKLARSIREEFEQANITAIEEYNAKKEAGDLPDGAKFPICKKVTPSIISSVRKATESLTVLPARIDTGTWLPDGTKPQFISLKNGILNMEAVFGNNPTLEEVLWPNSPSWFSMVSLPYEFNEEAECPRWMSFLEYNLEGDQERIRLVQEWAGYLLTTNVSMQAFMILEGEGSNGKSVFISAITAMLGQDNVSTVPLEVFGERFQLHQTLGKLLNAAGDCGQLDKTAEGYLKAFTGGDRMTFEKKRQDGFSCRPTARLMLACNNRPHFSDRTDGTWRRMLVVPWLVKVAKEKKIRGMDTCEWWESSGELPGMLNWAVLGLHRLLKQGHFTESQVSSAALESYRTEMSPERQFIDENLLKKSMGEVLADPLYRIYVKWCDQHGNRAMSQTKFVGEVARFFGLKFNRNHRRKTVSGAMKRVLKGIWISSDEVAGVEIDADFQGEID